MAYWLFKTEPDEFSIDDLQALGSTPEPWLGYVAYNAPHDPFQLPPADLYTVDTTGGHPTSNPRPIYKAMVEALDTEIGRLLEGIPPAVLARTTIVFFGDNGTPSGVIAPPGVQGQAKGTVYDGGVNVLVDWESNDESVLLMSPPGVNVNWGNALAPGTITVTARWPADEFSPEITDTVTVEVLP